MNSNIEANNVNIEINIVETREAFEATQQSAELNIVAPELLQEQQEMDGGAQAALSEMEITEQQEMDQQTNENAAEVDDAEQQEMDEDPIVGYSSSYWEHQMAAALREGNKIAYENAKVHWSEEKAKEATKS